MSGAGLRWVVGAVCLVGISACAAAPGSAITPTTAASTTLDGVTLNGVHVSLASDRGHPVVLVFWGSWCGPCHDEQPALNTEFTRWSQHGVVFLGVDLRDDTSAALAFQNQEHVPYQSVADPDEMIATAFHVPAAPALVFIDRTGQVIDTTLGGLGVMSVADFDSEVRALVAS